MSSLPAYSTVIPVGIDEVESLGSGGVIVEAILLVQFRLPEEREQLHAPTVGLLACCGVRRRRGTRSGRLAMKADDKRSHEICERPISAA
jgi:hypothetical protein